MNKLVRLERNWWWRGFWSCYFAGAGIWGLVVNVWPFALLMAVLLTIQVLLWMLIDRKVARQERSRA